MEEFQKSTTETPPPSQIATRNNVKSSGLQLHIPFDNTTSRKRVKPGVISETVSEAISGDMGDENGVLLEQNLTALYNQDQHSNKDIIGAILAGNKLTAQKLKPLENALSQIVSNTERITKVEARITTVESSQNHLADKVAILEQAKLECHATITGFKVPPDENQLKAALCGFFKVEEVAILSVRSFTINASKPNQMVITNLVFRNTMDKAKLITAKIAKGEMRARQFFPSLSDTQGANNTIFIGHKLTSTNIKLRKMINDLKSAGKVVAKRFRNNKHQIQLHNNSEWHDIATVESLQLLVN